MGCSKEYLAVWTGKRYGVACDVCRKDVTKREFILNVFRKARVPRCTTIYVKEASEGAGAGAGASTEIKSPMKKNADKAIRERKCPGCGVVFSSAFVGAGWLRACVHCNANPETKSKINDLYHNYHKLLASGVKDPTGGYDVPQFVDQYGDILTPIVKRKRKHSEPVRPEKKQKIETFTPSEKLAELKQLAKAMEDAERSKVSQEHANKTMQDEINQLERTLSEKRAVQQKLAEELRQKEQSMEDFWRDVEKKSKMNS
jgi:hypothetical protein